MADGSERTPDLVLVENDDITDIFELKFVPHDYAKWKADVDKLLRYKAQDDEQDPVHLKPETGQWDRYLPVRDGCLLHFVAVAKRDAEAVWPLKVSGRGSEINHWFGQIRSGGGKWDIAFA